MAIQFPPEIQSALMKFLRGPGPEDEKKKLGGMLAQPKDPMEAMGIKGLSPPAPPSKPMG